MRRLANSGATFGRSRRGGLGLRPSPTKPRPAGVWSLKICRKRASPQPAGEGLGVGVGVGGRVSCNNNDPPPPPSPTRGGGAYRGRGGGTESAATGGHFSLTQCRQARASPPRRGPRGSGFWGPAGQER